MVKNTFNEGSTRLEKIKGSTTMGDIAMEIAFNEGKILGSVEPQCTSKETRVVCESRFIEFGYRTVNCPYRTTLVGEAESQSIALLWL